jgi:hypothetical protein
MEQRDVTLIIYNLKDGDKFTFKIIKKDFPLLNYRRFHEIVKIFIHLSKINFISSQIKYHSKLSVSYPPNYAL